MYEVEVKVRADHDSVRARMEESGAERVDRVRQVDTYYDAPHRAFAETDEALRIRRETPEATPAGERADQTAAAGNDATVGDAATAGSGVTAGDDADRTTTRITYKGPLVEAESKTREEHETGVADGEEMDAVLRGLGFAPAATVEKTRERYALRGYTVTLDSVGDLGEFVEVEREAPEERIEAVRESAYDLLADLGLNPDEQIRTSYLGLLLHSE